MCLARINNLNLSINFGDLVLTGDLMSSILASSLYCIYTQNSGFGLISRETTMLCRLSNAGALEPLLAEGCVMIGSPEYASR